MSATAQKFKLSKELRHLELGKPWLKKPCSLKRLTILSPAFNTNMTVGLIF